MSVGSIRAAIIKIINAIATVIADHSRILRIVRHKSLLSCPILSIADSVFGCSKDSSCSERQSVSFVKGSLFCSELDIVSFATG